MTDNHRDHRPGPLFTPKWLQAVVQTWLIFDVDVRRPVDQAEVDVTVTYRDPDNPDRLHPLKFSLPPNWAFILADQLYNTAAEGWEEADAEQATT